jgi:hypothetical protein
MNKNGNICSISITPNILENEGTSYFKLNSKDHCTNKVFSTLTVMLTLLATVWNTRIQGILGVKSIRTFGHWLPSYCNICYYIRRRKGRLGSNLIYFEFQAITKVSPFQFQVLPLILRM